MSILMLQIEEMLNNQVLSSFVQVPHQIYAKDLYWPGTNDVEVMNYFDVKFNPALKYHKWQLFVAKIDGISVGRVCVSIWPNFNIRWNKQVAFFGFFECIDDQIVADELFNCAKEWARQQGMTELWGPINFNLEDELGILISGFAKVPTYGMPYNPPYYQDLLERAGFVKEKDFMEVSYPINFFTQNAEKLESQLKSLIEDPSYRIRSLETRSLTEDLQRMVDIHNQSMRTHWGSGEMHRDEMVDKLHHIYDCIGPQELFLVAEHQGRLVGFTYFHNDLNQLMYAKRHNAEAVITRVRGNSIGLLPEYQSNKLGTWLIVEIAKRLQQCNFRELQIGWILEDNTPSLRLCKNLGGKIDKIFRVYRSAI